MAKTEEREKSKTYNIKETTHKEKKKANTQTNLRKEKIQEIPEEV